MSVARVSGPIAVAVVAACVLALAIANPASATTYRLVLADGTVHYTNAPTDPLYQRLGRGARSAAVPGPAAPPRRRETFTPLIREAAHRYHVPEPLVQAVIRVESAFNPGAVSRKGARGLMQLMPQTAALLGVRDSFDPAENIDGGVRHLRRLLERFGHDLRLALAAYNAGENAVLQHGGIPPYAETQGYVEKVLALYRSAVPDAGEAGRPMPEMIFRTVDADGAPVYTNIPPSGHGVTRGASRAPGIARGVPR